MCLACEQARLLQYSRVVLQQSSSQHQSSNPCGRPNPLVESSGCQNMISPMGCQVIYQQKHSRSTSTCAGGVGHPLPPDTGSGWSQFPATHLLQVSCFGPITSTPQALPWAEIEGMKYWPRKSSAIALTSFYCSACPRKSSLPLQGHIQAVVSLIRGHQRWHLPASLKTVQGYLPSSQQGQAAWTSAHKEGLDESGK